MEKIISNGRRRISSDLLSGLLFLSIGLFFAVYAYSYSLGSFAQLGPGAFPFGVGVVLAIIGVALTLKSFAESGEPVAAFNLKSAGLITLGLIIGGATLTSLGVVVSVPAAVAISSLASGSLRPRVIFLMALLLTIFTYLVFIVALGIQLPLYPGAH